MSNEKMERTVLIFVTGIGQELNPW